MYVSELLIKIGEYGLVQQFESGAMPKGHNGPWNNEDTFVRTTAHWAIIFYKCFELTSIEEFKTAAIKSCNYLISKESIPFDNSFYCRVSSKLESRQNGLIGQAWGVEPLLLIGQKENIADFTLKAIKILRSHYFNIEKNGWHHLHVDGSVGAYDFTLNQQIWFALMCLKSGDKVLIENSTIFFENIKKNIKWILKNRLVAHTNHASFSKNLLDHLKILINNYVYLPRYKKRLNLSVGYQSFILSGVVQAYRRSGLNFKELLSLFEETFIDSIDFKYLKKYKKNKYAFSYNLTGFELALVAEYLNVPSASKKWIQNQILFLELKINEGELALNEQIDKNIVVSRFYELTFLKEDYNLDYNLK